MSKNDDQMIQYVLYREPRDFPHDYVVRSWSISEGKIEPLSVVVKSGNLTTIYDHMGSMGLYYMPRQTNDDPCIMGVWI